MSVVAEDKQYRLDWLKWLVVLTLLGGAIYANWYYSAESVLYRVVGFLVVLGAAGLVASQTAKGAATVELAVGARIEWRKVVLAYQAREKPDYFDCSGSHSTDGADFVGN